MITKILEITYSEYSSVNELPQKDANLLNAAVEALNGSYAPYSNFNVGAAVLLDNGVIVKGANQENIAYPSGLCAERTALFSAHANYPDNKVVSIALTSSQNGLLLATPPFPCGACRQVMAQTQTRNGSPLKIIIGGSDKILVFNSVESLLPFIFASEEVGKNQ